MKIEKFRSEKNRDRVRVSATVIWEDCDRPAQEIFFETDIRFADCFASDPHAYLVACILPAMRYGEKRIFLDAEICPELREGLVTVMSWMRHWGRYKPRQEIVRIEAKTQTEPTKYNRPERAGLFLSGGIDSLATLRANHLTYPTEHPGYIRDGLIVSGLEVYETDKFEHVLRSVSAIASDSGITLIPVQTNIRDLGPEDRVEFWTDFWVLEYMSAAFAAIAHTLKKRFSKAYLSSDHDIPSVPTPYGTHPLINHNYSSCELTFTTFGSTLSRFEKTKLIANWDTALQHLRVCNNSLRYQTGILNCGECEKCMRTKLALLALGVLDKARNFDNNDITIELVKSVVHLSDTSLTQYNKDLLSALADSGHSDLASIIQHKIAIKKIKQISRKMTIEKIRKFDRNHLNSNILKFKRLFYKKGILE